MIAQADRSGNRSGRAFRAAKTVGAAAGCRHPGSMDGRRRCMDNVFIERLWRSLKYEAVYLHELADGRAARRVIGQWMAFYNEQRPHSALGGRTPAQCYDGDRRPASRRRSDEPTTSPDRRAADSGQEADDRADGGRRDERV